VRTEYDLKKLEEGIGELKNRRTRLETLQRTLSVNYDGRNNRIIEVKLRGLTEDLQGLSRIISEQEFMIAKLQATPQQPTRCQTISGDE